MRHCKFAWDQFQRSTSLATDTMTHTVEVAEIANLGLVFLLFMIGWETQFFRLRHCRLSEKKFHLWRQWLACLATDSVGLRPGAGCSRDPSRYLEQSPWQVSIANTFHHFPALVVSQMSKRKSPTFHSAEMGRVVLLTGLFQFPVCFGAGALVFVYRRLASFCTCCIDAIKKSTPSGPTKT